MYSTNTGWCVICRKMLCIVRRDLRRVPYSSTLCNSSCIAAFLKYGCSCQTISTSATELLIVGNSFELILVYSCPICSHGCLILCHCQCQALGSCEGLQKYWEGKQSSWLWRSSHGQCFSRIHKPKQIPRTCPDCDNHANKLTSWNCSSSVPSLMPKVVGYPGA